MKISLKLNVKLGQIFFCGYFFEYLFKSKGERGSKRKKWHGHDQNIYSDIRWTTALISSSEDEEQATSEPGTEEEARSSNSIVAIS